jgi:hypothetical protein
LLLEVDYSVIFRCFWWTFLLLSSVSFSVMPKRRFSRKCCQCLEFHLRLHTETQAKI